VVEAPATSGSLKSHSRNVLQAITFAPGPMQFLMSDTADPNTRSLDRKLALRYYIQTFTPILTTSFENNGFLSGIYSCYPTRKWLRRILIVYSVLMPMAIEDRPLLDMLIAWSSSHLSLGNDIYHVRALEHRSTALKSFASSLSVSTQSPEISLAGCLVFCSMSAILGDTAAWHNHLDGAAEIIRSARSNYEHYDLAAISRTYEGRWLLRNFAYHDILMSVTSDREPLIPGQYWISEEKTTIDSYFGLASEPMALLSMISFLNGDMVRHDRQPSVSGSDSAESSTADWAGTNLPVTRMDSFSARACQIETDLQNWKCSGSHDPCLVSQAETYRGAALIHLYRVIRHHVPGIMFQESCSRNQRGRKGCSSSQCHRSTCSQYAPEMPPGMHSAVSTFHGGWRNNIESGYPIHPRKTATHSNVSSFSKRCFGPVGSRGTLAATYELYRIGHVGTTVLGRHFDQTWLEASSIIRYIVDVDS
jgi:hypothetical protein